MTEQQLIEATRIYKLVLPYARTHGYCEIYAKLLREYLSLYKYPSADEAAMMAQEFIDKNGVMAAIDNSVSEEEVKAKVKLWGFDSVSDLIKEETNNGN